MHEALSSIPSTEAIGGEKKLPWDIIDATIEKKTADQAYSKLWMNPPKVGRDSTCLLVFP